MTSRYSKFLSMIFSSSDSVKEVLDYHLIMRPSHEYQFDKALSIRRQIDLKLKDREMPDLLRRSYIDIMYEEELTTLDEKNSKIEDLTFLIDEYMKLDIDHLLGLIYQPKRDP